MFEEASEVFDNMFKSSFPLTFIVFIPAVLILVSPLPAEAAHEFTVYRMQQYDLQGQPYGETAFFCLLFTPCVLDCVSVNHIGARVGVLSSNVKICLCNVSMTGGCGVLACQLLIASC